MRSGYSLPVRYLMIGIVLVELIILYLVLDQSSWAYDDNFLLVLAGREGFTWHWLTSVQFEHWDIGWHAVISLQYHLFFFDYRWALVAMLGLLGGAMYLLERILRMIIRERWVAIVFMAWFGLSTLWVRPLQWWAAGTQYLPYTFFDLLCLYGFFRYYTDKAYVWLAVSVLALTAGLLFYEKPAYMLIYLVSLRVLLMSEDLHPRVILASFWREKGVWASYVVVILLWGIGYIDVHAYSTTHGAVSLGEYLEYYFLLWTHTIVPIIFDVTIPAYKLSVEQIAFVCIAQLAVVICILISVKRKWSAWRAWIFLAVAVLTNGALVAHSRVPIYSPGIASDPRYMIDFSWLVPLALCGAFMKSDTFVLSVPPKGVTRLSLPSSKLLMSLGLALFVSYTVVATASALRLEKIWAGPQAREWEKRVRSGISSLERKGIHPVVANKTTPFEIMAELAIPYNRLSSLLPLYVGPVQVDGPLDAPLVSIANNGTVSRAKIVKLSTRLNPASLIGRHELIVSGGRTVWQGQAPCVIADGAPVTVERLLNHDLYASKEASYYAILEYKIWHPLELGVFVNNGSGYSLEPVNMVALSPSAHASIVWLTKGTPQQVKVVIPQMTTVCIKGFEVVGLGVG